MSYCRFSSFDFRCDVYCYESAIGYQTQVAANRVVFAEPLPEPVPYDPDKPDWADRWVRRSQKVFDMVLHATRVDIGLPHDGQSFLDSTPGDCADRLESLKKLGYIVPDVVIAELREEELLSCPNNVDRS